MPGTMELLRRVIILMDRYQRQGDPDDLFRAIDVMPAIRDGLLPGLPEYTSLMSSFGDILTEAYSIRPDPELLARAVEYGRTAVGAATRQHPLAKNLSALVDDVDRHADSSEDPDALREAAATLRRYMVSMPGADPDAAMNHYGLANRLRLLYERVGDPDLLQQAIEAARIAITLPLRQNEFRIAREVLLASVLQRSFEHSGDPGELREAVEIYREAVPKCPGDGPDRTLVLSWLGGALMRLGDLDDDLDLLTESTQVLRAAMSSTDNPKSLTHTRSDLCTALSKLYEKSRDRRLLEEAIEIGRETVAGLAVGDPDRAISQQSLALAEFRLADATEDVDLLRQAITDHRSAMAALPSDHKHRAAFLLNAASMLRTHYAATGELDSLDEAVSDSRAALAAATADRQQTGPYLYNLAIVLAVQYGHTQTPETVAEALDCARAALAAGMAGSPEHTAALHTLIDILEEMSREGSGDSHHAEG